MDINYLSSIDEGIKKLNENIEILILLQPEQNKKNENRNINDLIRKKKNELEKKCKLNRQIDYVLNFIDLERDIVVDFVNKIHIGVMWNEYLTFQNETNQLNKLIIFLKRENFIRKIAKELYEPHLSDLDNWLNAEKYFDNFTNEKRLRYGPLACPPNINYDCEPYETVFIDDNIYFIRQETKKFNIYSKDDKEIGDDKNNDSNQKFSITVYWNFDYDITKDIKISRDKIYIADSSNVKQLLGNIKEIKRESVNELKITYTPCKKIREGLNKKYKKDSIIYFGCYSHGRYSYIQFKKEIYVCDYIAKSEGYIQNFNYDESLNPQEFKESFNSIKSWIPYKMKNILSYLNKKNIKYDKNNEKRVVELFLNNLQNFNFQTSSSY